MTLLYAAMRMTAEAAFLDSRGINYSIELRSATDCNKNFLFTLEPDKYDDYYVDIYIEDELAYRIEADGETRDFDGESN
jgi:hypothetical protein